MLQEKRRVIREETRLQEKGLSEKRRSYKRREGL